VEVHFCEEDDVLKKYKVKEEKKRELIFPIDGVQVGTAATGLRYKERQDLAIFVISPGSNTSCFFTKNKFAAAPIEIAKRNIEKNEPLYLIINSGNANAGTGENGLTAASRICESLAAEAGCEFENVLPFSTGVIGEELDYSLIVKHIPKALYGVTDEGWMEAAEAIMTTDTFPKVRSKKFTLGNDIHTVTGICKGSGMIRPDMATMLAYIATDANVSEPLLKKIGQTVLQSSFNRITVDGETSTNDAVVFIATGRTGSDKITTESDSKYLPLLLSIDEICSELAKDIVRDGEGASKLVSVEVAGAKTDDEAALVAYSVAESSLVKTALFAEDPNWGRILSAVGASGVQELDFSKVDLFVGEHKVASKGALAAEYQEEKVASVMKNKEFSIRVDLKNGECETTVWTCDLSYDYVRINSEYRS